MNLEERLEIGKRIYNSEINKSDAAKMYGISEDTARTYMRMYRDRNNLVPKNKSGEKNAVCNDSDAAKCRLDAIQRDIQNTESVLKAKKLELTAINNLLRERFVKLSELNADIDSKVL